jgi:PAS domain S-box-containing protein
MESELGAEQQAVLENRLLRERLVEQEERLRLALEAASLGTWEHIPSTHSTYWDARSKAIFGLGPGDELDFERYTAALHPSDAQSVFDGIAKATDPSGSGECTLRYRIRDVHGVERWVEAHGRCTFAGGVPQRINGTLLDITERQSAEEAVREAVRRKDEFLALLGHELRNPLAPILTALELMRLSHSEQFAREREVIERQVRHMMRLVDDLLDLARIARGTATLRREVTDLRSAVEQAVEISSPLFEDRKHRLEVSVPPDIWVDVDRIRFAQVVSNLLTNAAKFTRPGGEVRLRASRQDAEVLLEVEDNGIGVRPQHLASLFEPFVQVARRDDPAYGGLGLGLALVRDLVQLHGGTVSAASDGPGRGSRFTIRLPAAFVPARTASTAHAATGDESSTQRARRVLVVDDNEDSAEMLGLLIAQLGHSVRIAYDGPRALSLAAEFAPDLAVLDIGLPVMDGYELAAHLKERHGASGLRLVALSGFGQEQDKARSRAAGFDRHLTKPVDANELEAALAD